MSKPTISRVSSKLYRCTRCGHKSEISTNHWGECYPTCKNCSWKNPMSPIVIHECLELCPETHDKPQPWRVVKLGDVARIF